MLEIYRHDVGEQEYIYILIIDDIVYSFEEFLLNSYHVAIFLTNIVDVDRSRLDFKYLKRISIITFLNKFVGYKYYYSRNKVYFYYKQNLLYDFNLKNHFRTLKLEKIVC